MSNDLQIHVGRIIRRRPLQILAWVGSTVSWVSLKMAHMFSSVDWLPVLYPRSQQTIIKDVLPPSITRLIQACYYDLYGQRCLVDTASGSIYFHSDGRPVDV